MHKRRAARQSGPRGNGAIEDYFKEARARRKELAANPERVEQALRSGAERARAEARKTMELVRTAVGMKAKPE